MKRLLCTLLLTSCTSAWASHSNDFNFRFSPLGLIVGSIHTALDYKVTPSWTVGPEISYWHLSVGSSTGYSSSFDVKSFGVGVRGNWFYNGVYTDGFYVGPSLKYASTSLSVTRTDGSDVSAKASGMFAGALVGYGWFWDSFNIMLGIGATLNLGGENKVTITDSNGDKTPVRTGVAGLDAEFSIGWTF